MIFGFRFKCFHSQKTHQFAFIAVVTHKRVNTPGFHDAVVTIATTTLANHVKQAGNWRRLENMPEQEVKP